MSLLKSAHRAFAGIGMYLQRGGDLVEVLHGAVLVMSIRSCAAVAAYAVDVMLARWLGASEFGIYNFALAWLTLLAIVACLGLPGASLRFVPEYIAAGDRSALRGLLRRSSLLVLATGVVISVLGIGAILLGRIDLDERYVIPVSIALLGIPLAALVQLNTETARGFGWLVVAYAPAQLAMPILLLGAALFMLQVHGSLTGTDVVVATILSLALVLLYQSVTIRRRARSDLRAVAPTFDTWRWVGVSLPLLLINGITAFSAQLDLILVGAFREPDEIGFYAAAAKVAVLVSYVAYGVLGLMEPKIASLYSKEKHVELQSLLSGLIHWVFWPSLLITLAVILLADFLLGLFGPRFVAGYWPLVLLALGNMAVVSTGPTRSLLTMTGHQGDCLLVSAATLALNVILVALLTPVFGIVGTAAATAFAMLVRSAWLLAVVNRKLGLQPSLLSAFLRAG